MSLGTDDDDHRPFIQPTASDLAALATFMPSFSFDETPQPDPTASPTTAAHDDEKSNTRNPAEEEEEEDGFDFKLFSRAPTKVTLTEPRQESYAVPIRSKSYYFHPPPSPTALKNLRHAAIDTATVLEMSRVRYPWNSRPGRLTEIKSPDDVSSTGVSGGGRVKRWRPSKKRREKFKAIKEAEDAKAKRIAALKVQTYRGVAAASRGRGARGRGRGGSSFGGRGASSEAAVTGKSRSGGGGGGGGGGYPRKGALPV